jgi:hypothetical protein
MSKPYFKKVKVGRKVYGLVFGRGKVVEVFDEGHYKFIVKFKNGFEVPYTIEGIPSWGNFSEQTLYYKKDIDLSSYDFTAASKVLSVKKIIKLRDKNKLEVRLPSGIWCECTSCVEEYVEEMLEKQKFHLFRKRP